MNALAQLRQQCADLARELEKAKSENPHQLIDWGGVWADLRKMHVLSADQQVALLTKHFRRRREG